MRLRPKALFSEEEDTQETGFEKKGKYSFHGECLPYDSTRGLGKAGPVSPELKLHRDARDHAHGEVDREDLGPESSRAAVVLVARPQRHGLENQDQQRQPHGQLWKDVVKSHRECEVQTVNR